MEDKIETVQDHIDLAINNALGLPNSREKSLVLTKLEEAELWLCKLSEYEK